MRTMLQRSISWMLALSCVVVANTALGGDSQVLPPINERFTAGDTDEVPSFQRHVIPLLGRLGCNGRACHGSFQGQGGFQLSLFGYDFAADHAQLTKTEAPRVDVSNPLDSLILIKPTDEFEHGGGLRYEKDSWQYHVLRRWVEGQAKFDAGSVEKLERLEVTPAEIIFQNKSDLAQLKATAVWANGDREDVTDLCRFQTNNEQIAQIDAHGQVQAGEAGDTHVVVFYDNAVVPVPILQPVTQLAGNKYPTVPTPTRIDELVVDKLRKLGIVPSDQCTDAEFLRRVSLDLTGTLPTPAEVEKFLNDRSPNKRAQKVDELLETPGYVAWWTTRLCDYTGNNDDQLINTTPVRGQASQAWYDWIYKRVEENQPYDQLVAGIVLSQSREPDEDYLAYCERMSNISREEEVDFSECSTMPFYWARREFRQPDERAIAFAYSFMGIRIQCAQCHKHPFDQWSKQDFEQFTGFFRYVTAGNASRAGDRQEYQKMLEELGLQGKRGNELRRRIPDLLKDGKTVPFPEIYVQKPRAGAQRRGRNARNAPQGQSPTAKLLGDELVRLTEYEDAREPLMRWLSAADNPYFARAFVNRVWANYFNVGIVNPPDDLSLANPPSNKPLLDYLSEGFVQSGYDMKWLHREILNSRTYQLSWLPNETNAADQRNFSRAVPRRLPAEVAYDAIQQATASDEKLQQLHDELDGRAIAIAAAGRRYGGRNAASYALTVFGRSTRESNCDCDRSGESSLLQTVYLQNDRDVLAMIERNDGWVRQVTGQLDKTAKDAGNDKTAAQKPAAANLQKMVIDLRKRMAQARKNGNRTQLVRLQRRMLEIQEQAQQQRVAAGRQARGSDREETPGPSRARAGNRDAQQPALDQLVRQAYLRTLSRYPEDWEADRSLSFIKESEDTSSGLQDLVWALLNTKEFILNH